MSSAQGRWNIGVVDPASANQREAVVRLRRQAYAEANEFMWNDMSTLGWSAADDDGVVIGVWGHGDEADDGGITALLSTVRASVFADAGAAETFLEHSLHGVGAAWPAMVLSRAATAAGRHRRGLMALLRCAYLQALTVAQVRSVLAVVYETAPRLNSMRCVGYTLTAPSRSWDSEARALTPPLLAHLSEAHFETALEAARKLAGATLPDAVIAQADIEAAFLRSSLRAMAPDVGPAGHQGRPGD